MSELEPVELLAELVAIDSQNPGAGEKAVARHLHEIVTGLGLEARIFEAARGRSNLLITADAGGKRSVALAGHLDTKPVGDARAKWRTPPLQLVIEDDLAYGLGTSDMKGAVAAMVVAAQRWARQTHSGRLELILTADEESGSELGSRVLADVGMVDVDAIVIGEPSGIVDPWEAMFLVSRGVCCFEVKIEGTQGHSGLSDRLPTSATVAAARAVLALADWQPTFDPSRHSPYSPTVNPGVRVQGGVFFGVHPGHATVACDIRLVPGMTRERLDRELHETLQRAMPADVDWEVQYRTDLLGWMPAVEISPDHPVVSAAQAACWEVLGRRLPYAAYPGGTDATAFTAIAGIPTIASLGPGWLSVAHGPNERVGVSQVQAAARLYERLVRRYLDPQSGGSTGGG